MLTPNDAQLSSPTDRAVKIAAGVLLPTVFGFFVVQHLWLTPEATSQPPTLTAAVAGDSPQLSQQSIHVGGATAPGVTVAMEVGPVIAHNRTCNRCNGTRSLRQRAASGKPL
jgi:hypothetical protein